MSSVRQGLPQPEVCPEWPLPRHWRPTQLSRAAFTLDATSPVTCPTSWCWPSPASPGSVGAACHHHRPSPSQAHGPGRSPSRGAALPADTDGKQKEETPLRHVETGTFSTKHPQRPSVSPLLATAHWHRQQSLPQGSLQDPTQNRDPWPHSYDTPFLAGTTSSETQLLPKSPASLSPALQACPSHQSLHPHGTTRVANTGLTMSSVASKFHQRCRGCSQLGKRKLSPA